MKRLKIISIVLMLCFIAVMFTGCFGVDGSIKINADGSTSVSVFVGYTKEAYELAAETEGGTDGDIDTALSTFTVKEINGVKYYGEYEKSDFDTIDDFNSYMYDVIRRENLCDFKLSKNDDGTLKLSVVFTDDIGRQYIMKQTIPSEVEEDVVQYRQIEELMKDYIVLFDIEFPDEFVMTNGKEVEGFTVDGNKLHINMQEVLDNIIGTPAEVYTFETLKDGDTAESKRLKFTDVSEKSWYYKPVMTLAAGDVIKGMGDGTFKPEDDIKYSEFCQMLASVCGIGEVGEQNGYWAYKAVELCLDMGYIDNLGEITPENYDVPISRQAAISAIARMHPDGMVFVYGDEITHYTEKDIPDYDLIAEEFRSDIIKAYNLAITKGKDSTMRFDPEGTLIRAEVCQLFYNIKKVIVY